jgi:crossover junction endodeoxyribonuclease RuvC
VLVLGVDPGLTRCGLGLVEGAAGRPLALRHVEVVSTPSTTPLADRLLLLSSRIRDLLSDDPPDVVAVERMFSQHNLHTVMGTAQASAAAVLAAAEAGVPVVWHTPSEVKAAVTGSGRADKAQVAAMVVRILGLAAAPKPVDATDALALAICHAWRGSATERLDRAAAGAPASRIPRRSPNRSPAARPMGTAQPREGRATSASVPLPGARVLPPRPAR